MNEHARPAASAPHRPIAFAPARVERAILPDGTIRIACSWPILATTIRASRGCSAPRSRRSRHGPSCRSAARTAGASSPMRRRARDSRCDCGRAARARAFGGTAGDDPVGQCDRSCAADACRIHSGHPGRADIGRVFAAKPGLRQAQAHRRTARTRPDLRCRHRAVRQGARGDRRRRRNRREPQRRQPRSVTPFDDLARSSAGPAVDRPPQRRAPTPSPRSCSPPARPDCPRASSTPTAC